MKARSITIPSPEELRQRIRACQVELQEFRRLLRMALAAERADQARKRSVDDSHCQGGQQDDRANEALALSE